MTSRFLSGALALAAGCVLANAAFAHATFETATAKPDSSWKGVLRVPHGCDGQATRLVRVTIPEGVIAAKPMPKAGWALQTSKGPYAKSYDLHGKPVADGVKEIVWSGGELPDDQFDEFVFQARVTGKAEGGSYYFPVTQECANGKVAWDEIPAAGQDAHALKRPAPGLTLAQAKGEAQEAKPPKAVRVGDLMIEQPWTRATPGGAKVAGGYLRIKNVGATPDRLVGGSSPIAGRFEIHEMAVADGMMKMRPLDQGLTIAPGATVELKPGSYHLMLMELKEPVKSGDLVKATLRFEKAGSVDIALPAAPVGASAPSAAEADKEHKHH